MLLVVLLRITYVHKNRIVPDASAALNTIQSPLLGTLQDIYRGADKSLA